MWYPRGMPVLTGRRCFVCVALEDKPGGQLRRPWDIHNENLFQSLWPGSRLWFKHGWFVDNGPSNVGSSNHAQEVSKDHPTMRMITVVSLRMELHSVDRLRPVYHGLDLGCCRLRQV